MRRVLSIVVLSTCYLLVGTYWASAGSVRSVKAAQTAKFTLVTLDDPKPGVTTADSGWTVDVGLTNVSVGDVVVSAAPKVKGVKGCVLVPKPSTVPAAQHAKITVTIPSACEVKDGFDFQIAATQGRATQAALTINAAKPGPRAPNWGALVSFPIAFVVLIVMFVATFAMTKWKPTDQLAHLEPKWSFTDSWVNTVTVAAGLLTGIFGSSGVVKALLGKDADDAVALATVGAAIAAAIIAASPLVVTVFKKGGNVTIAGFFLAASLTLTGAFGELWVVGQAGAKLDLGGFQDNVILAVVAAMLLLAAYAVRSLHEIVTTGLTTPPPPAPDAMITAAEMIVHAIDGAAHNDKAAFRAALAPTLAPAIATPDAPVRRRSALL
jgi:uncharacterized membrane protein